MSTKGNTAVTFIKGMGTGMLAGMAVAVAGKMIINDNNHISKGGAKAVKAMGDFVDGLHTMIK